MTFAGTGTGATATARPRAAGTGGLEGPTCAHATGEAAWSRPRASSGEPTCVRARQNDETASENGTANGATRRDDGGNGGWTSRCASGNAKRDACGCRSSWSSRRGGARQRRRAVARRGHSRATAANTAGCRQIRALTRIGQGPRLGGERRTLCDGRDSGGLIGQGPSSEGSTRAAISSPAEGTSAAALAGEDEGAGAGWAAAGAAFFFLRGITARVAAGAERRPPVQGPGQARHSTLISSAAYSSPEGTTAAQSFAQRTGTAHTHVAGRSEGGMSRRTQATPKGITRRCLAEEGFTACEYTRLWLHSRQAKGKPRERNRWRACKKGFFG